MKKYKQYVFLVIGTIFFLSTAIIGWNIIVDPYWAWDIYSKVGFNKQKTNIEYLDSTFKPLHMMRRDPEIIILGTSRACNALDPEYYNHSKRGYNLAIPAANLYETRYFFEHAVLTSENLQEVILSVNFFAFNDKNKPEKGFDKKQLSSRHITFDNFISLTLSKDAILKSMKDIRFNVKEKGTYSRTLENGMVSEESQQKLSSGIVDETGFSTNVKEFVQKESFYKNYTSFTERMNDFKAIVQLCKEKNFLLKVIIPPIHASQLEGIVASGSWECYEEWKRELVKIAPIMDFTSYNEYTTEAFSDERKYFWDSSHMKPVVGNIIMDVLANRASVSDFGVLITPDNIEQHLQKIRNQRDAWRENNPDLVEKIAFFKGFILRKPSILKEKTEILGENVFKVENIAGHGFIDKQLAVRQITNLEISGWSLFNGTTSSNVFFMLKAINGDEYYAVANKTNRQDVADMMLKNDYIRSGFNTQAALDDVPLGLYDLYIMEVGNDNYVYSSLIGKIDIQ